MESNSYLEVGSLNERLVSTIVPRKGLSISNIFSLSKSCGIQSALSRFSKAKIKCEIIPPATYIIKRFD